MITLINNLTELQSYALNFKLPWGACLALKGDLGAGKTTFCKYYISHLVSCDVNLIASPTFGLVHSYPAGEHTVYHLDWYRLDTEANVLQLGIDDMLNSQNILLIEWMDKFPTLMHQMATHMLTFSCDDSGKRTLDFNPL